MLYNNPNKIYTSPKGRQFRVIGVEKIEDSGKWINRVFKWKWKAILKMLDTGELLEQHVDYNDEQIKIKRYEQIQKDSNV